MAQIINITSEALQATIRRLLPSQQGFGEDLQATNVVTPIIDLTATAEGSVLPQYLQQSVNYGGATSIEVSFNTVDVANSPGFYRVIGTAFLRVDPTASKSVTFRIDDGSTPKNVWRMRNAASSTQDNHIIQVDLVFFLRAGDTLQVVASNNAIFDGSIRQVADVNGNLVNPVGFTFE